jgi:uncharacterized membrane protein
MSKTAKKRRVTSVKTPSSAKKAIVLGESKNNRNPTYILLGLALLALCATGVAVWVTGPSGSAVTAGVAATVNAAEVRLPVAQFEDGEARHFDHQFDGLTVRYFIVKSSDGVVRAAFDACDVCWPAGKGYVQEGDVMICRNCGRRFASTQINEVKGGCNPAPLKRVIDGDQLVIQVADIAEGKSYFKLDQKG